MTTSPLDHLRWRKFPVLDDGFVCLVDAMGDDHAVVEAARVSYASGTRRVSDDRTLIRYLMRHWHTTPFEMAEVKLLVRVPMDCWRQWIRHRMASINETSTRYSIAIDAAQTTPADRWRFQATGNRQGSEGFVDAAAGAGAFGRGSASCRARPAGLRAPVGVGHRPGAGPQGPSALDVYRGVLEGRFAQPAPLPATAAGPARNWRFASMPRRSASRSSARSFRWCGRRLPTTGWKRYN